jgi:hypothetical protein
VAEHLVEDTGGPAAVGHTRTALGVGGAHEPEVGDTVPVEPLGGEPEPAATSAPAGAAQRDSAIRTRRLLEVATNPHRISHMNILFKALRLRQSAEAARREYPPAVDLTPRLLGTSSGAETAVRWAESGAMWLTGRPEGPMIGCPSDVIEVLDGAAHTLHTVTKRHGRPVVVDGPALLGERAALLGFRRNGDVSCGGATRLLRTAEDWVALSLPRPDDVELLPAWLGVKSSVDPWPAITASLVGRATDEVVESGAELGLPVAQLGERADDKTAVAATRLGDVPPLVTLEGARVVDLSSLWAGPLAGQLLAAAGMDVVKVESTRRPDGARFGPPAFYDLMNVGKASVALDFQAPEGAAALRRLLLAAEVVIESSRPRALEQLGVEPTEIVATGATRVWLSITGHGRDEPHRHRIAFGDDAAVAGGLVAHDATGPMFCADAIADPATGLLAATAVIDRLTAGGRWLVDVALARTAARMATGVALTWEGEVAPPRARPPAGRAAPLGRDTRRVLDEPGDAE